MPGDAYESYSICPITEMKLDFNSFNKSKRRKYIHNKMQLILNKRYVDPSPSLFTLILYKIVAGIFLLHVTIEYGKR